MAATLVNQTTGILDPAGTTTTIAVTATPGNSLILAIGLSLGPTSSVTAVSDTGGNTWVLPDPPYGGASGGTSTLFRVAYVHNCANPGTITVTHSSGVSQISVIEVSGLDNVSPTAAAEDVSNAATTTAFSSGSLTAGTGDFVFGVIEHGGTATVSGLPAGWTALTDPPAVSVNVHLRTAYVLSSAGGTEQLTYTGSGSARYAGGIIALPVAAGGGGGGTYGTGTYGSGTYGDLTPSAPAVTGSATLSGQSGFTGAAIRQALGAATLSGISTQTTAGQAERNAGATLAGISTQVSSAQRQALASGTFSAIGTATITGQRVATGSSTQSAIGTLTNDTSVQRFGSGTFAGISTFASSASNTTSGASSLAGLSGITSTAGLEKYFSASLLGTSTLGASGSRFPTGSATLNAVSTLVSNGTIVYNAVATLAGQTGGSFTASKQLRGAGVLAGLGSVTGASSLIKTGQATFVAESSFLAAEASNRSVLGDALLVGVGGMSTFATHLALGSATLVGQGVFTSQGTRYALGSGVFAGTSNLSSTSQIYRLSSANLSAGTGFNTVGMRTVNASGVFDSQSGIVASASRLVSADAFLSGDTTLSSLSSVELTSEAYLTSQSDMDTVISRILTGEVILVGQSNLRLTLLSLGPSNLFLWSMVDSVPLTVVEPSMRIYQQPVITNLLLTNALLNCHIIVTQDWIAPQIRLTENIQEKQETSRNLRIDNRETNIAELANERYLVGANRYIKAVINPQAEE